MVLLPLKPTLASLLLASTALALKPADSNLVPGKYIVTVKATTNSRERALVSDICFNISSRSAMLTAPVHRPTPRLSSRLSFAASHPLLASASSSSRS